MFLRYFLAKSKADVLINSDLIKRKACRLDKERNASRGSSFVPFHFELKSREAECCYD